MTGLVWGYLGLSGFYLFSLKRFALPEMTNFIKTQLLRIRRPEKSDPSWQGAPGAFKTLINNGAQGEGKARNVGNMISQFGGPVDQPGCRG